MFWTVFNLNERNLDFFLNVNLRNAHPVLWNMIY